MNAKLIKKIDKETTEMEKNVEKLKLISPKFKGVAILIGVTMAVGLAFGGFMAVSKWYDENQVSFQTPVIFQSPVVIKRRQSAEISSPVALQGQVMAKEVEPQPNLFEQAYDYVWFRESNRGKDVTGLNGYCISRGMINEIGFAPHENYCFKDREEQHQMFILWLNNRLNHVKMPYCNDIDGCLRVYSNGAYGFEVEK